MPRKDNDKEKARQGRAGGQNTALEYLRFFIAEAMFVLLQKMKPHLPESDILISVVMVKANFKRAKI